MSATSEIKSVLGLANSDFDSLFKSIGNFDNLEDYGCVWVTEFGWNSCFVKRPSECQRFDVRRIATIFLDKARQNPVGSNDKALHCDDALIYENCEPKTDLQFFIKVFLKYGKNINRALLRCGEFERSILERKRKLYGIVSEGRQGSRMTLTTISLTLERICQAFSVCTAAVIIDKNIKGKLGSEFFGNSIPVVMQHTIFPGLIPSDGDYTDTLRELALVLNMEMTFVLAAPSEKRKMCRKSVEELLDTATHNVEAAMSRSIFSDEAKLTILIKGDVLTAKSGNEPQFSLAVETMIKKLPTIKRFQKDLYAIAVKNVIKAHTIEDAAITSVSVN